MSESLENLPAFLDAESASLAAVSQHWYAEAACRGRQNPPDILLKAHAANASGRMLLKSVALTHAKGLPFEIGEMNSVACDGQAGVSDTFASALWMVDSLFELAKAQVDAVFIHGDSSDVYNSFRFKVDKSQVPYRYSIDVVRPEYYGILLFKRAVPPGSRLLPTPQPANESLKCWATIDETGTTRVVVVNKHQSDFGTVTVDGGGYNEGVIVRLTAPGYTAKDGIRIGGRTLDNSEDGLLRGKDESETAVRRDGGFELRVPPTSAALLTLRRPDERTNHGT
jgi:hypothetical protein